MDDVDREALERAMQMARRDAFRAQQLDDMLAGEPDGRGGWFISPKPWEKVAKFAAGVCQAETLNLKPWEAQPCHALIKTPEGTKRDPQAGVLLDEMLDAGLSRWEPSPADALRKARANE